LQKRIWITWEKQRRNSTLSKALNAKLFEFDLKCTRLLRYPVALCKTVAAFVAERPDLIFVQNPSLILALFAVNYGLIADIPVVVDAHNAGVYPFNGRRTWASKLAAYLFKKAFITIVTNNALAEYVSMHGGNAEVMPDPIPEFTPPVTKRVLKGNFNVLFICSWADDEPYDEVIQAARLLSKSVYVYITGNSRGKESKYVGNMPENVVLTDYLKEEDFIEMLYSCDVIMDLTTRDDCLVCGAYEAVAAEKPLIVSNSKALMVYFSHGVLYTNNTSSDISAQIDSAVIMKDDMQNQIKVLKKNMMDEWYDRLQKMEMNLRVRLKTRGAKV
jgi:hypothetical protein